MQLDGSGIQSNVIEDAIDRSLDSEERKRVCMRQRERKRQSPGCPLSPGPLKKLRHGPDERCNCNLSSESLCLEHGILAPSLVCLPLGRSPFT